MELQINTFKDTEKLLYSLSKLETTIANKEEYIQELKQYGARKRSGSVIAMPTSTNASRKSQEEIVDDMIEAIELDIFKLRIAISHVNKSLDTIRDDEYFPVIEMKYFDKLNHDYIAEELNISVATVSRNKNRLIRELALSLFTQNVVDTLLNA